MNNKIADLARELGIYILYLEQTTSTNDIASQGGYQSFDMVIADNQSKGRGSGGNSWSSDSKLNLTFSLVIAEDIKTKQSYFVSKCVALGIVSTIKDIAPEANVKIKWPNDIYIDDKKVCGILIENDICADEVSKSVVGIGLNVNQSKFDPSLPNPTSLKICCGRLLDRIEILENLSLSIKRYIQLLKNGELEEISQAYLENLYRYDSWHSFNDPKEGPFKARIIDVEDDGQIVMEDDSLATRRYYFKEVEYQI